MGDLIDIISTWFQGITNGLNFFGGALRFIVGGIGSLFSVLVDLPAFLVAFIGLGCFLIFANVVLKII